jgi:hypothetical protein
MGGSSLLLPQNFLRNPGPQVSSGIQFDPFTGHKFDHRIITLKLISGPLVYYQVNILPEIIFFRKLELTSKINNNFLILSPCRKK